MCTFDVIRLLLCFTDHFTSRTEPPFGRFYLLKYCLLGRHTQGGIVILAALIQLQCIRLSSTALTFRGSDTFLHSSISSTLRYNYLVSLTPRAISASAGSEPPVQFVHLIKAVNVVSENQAQLGHVVRALQDKDRMRDCEDSEEKEGRMNCDLLNRFIVIGGPFLDPGLNLQSKLQEQVP